MPIALQWSSVNAIHCTDIDGDGKPDIIAGGNEYGFLPQLERLDASRGAVMMNKGKGQFSLLGSDESGIEIDGQVRDIQEIKGGPDRQILFLRNDRYPLLFKLRKSNGHTIAASKANR